MQLNVLVLSYLTSAAISATVALVAWRRRSIPGARGLAILMFAVGWWLLANALEAAAIDRSAKIAWSVIAYPGIETVPVWFLVFVLGWTRQEGWLTRGRFLALLVVPLVSVVMAATNEAHRLLWSSVTLVDAWGVTAIYAHGPWFWVEMSYSYGLVGIGLLALLIAIYRYPRTYSTRVRVVFVGAFVPFGASLLYAAGLDSTLHADLSSVAFAISGLIAGWAILRARALDLAPVAWATLVDTLADAVVVLDRQGHVAARNSAAEGLLKSARTGEPGDSPADLPPDWFVRATAEATDGAGHEIEIELAPDGQRRWFGVRVTELRDSQERELGRLVVLHDVTEHRLALERIRELSLTDELTGLLNRRGFETLAEQQLRSAMRTRNRIWLMFADLDHLKAINDHYGHEAGDLTLCELAGLLKTAPFRAADIVGRIGGDEFAVLATEISGTDGAALTQRFRQALRNVDPRAPGREWPLSVSLGVAVFDPDRPQTLDELLRDADRRMYQVKHARHAGEARVAPRRRLPVVSGVRLLKRSRDRKVRQAVSSRPR